MDLNSTHSLTNPGEKPRYFLVWYHVEAKHVKGICSLRSDVGFFPPEVLNRYVANILKDNGLLVSPSQVYVTNFKEVSEADYNNWITHDQSVIDFFDKALDKSIENNRNESSFPDNR